MVAYLFPPVGGIGAAGSQRVLKFAKYLPTYNWNPVVLTVQEAYYESYLSLDQTLLEKIPSGVTIIKTPVFRWFSRMLEFQKAAKTRLAGEHLAEAMTAAQTVEEHPSSNRSRFQQVKDAITDLFEIPDEEMGWIVPSLFAGFRVIKRDSLDAIYATGRPWTALVVGAILRQLTQKPLIADFRDPWITNPFRTQYSALKNRAEYWLEKYVVEKANLILANTTALKEEFIERFPHQPADKFVTLLNGYDSDDYHLSEAIPNGINQERLTITHTGFLYGKRDPKTFLEAVKFVVEKQLIDPRKLQVCFVGSVELPYDLPAYLSSIGLNKVVVLHEHVPYRKSLEFLQQSDVLLLLQPGTTTQIPSKLFEYIGMRKPLLAISPHQGATCQLIREENLGHIVDPDNIEEIGNTLSGLYAAWEAGSLKMKQTEAVRRKFDIQQITGSLATMLNNLAYS
jgi:glycosyltransferase involved in cell wall biosynthesis